MATPRSELELAAILQQLAVDATAENAVLQLAAEPLTREEAVQLRHAQCQEAIVKYGD